MSLLFENPYPLAVIFCLTAAIFFGGFLRTQRKSLIFGSLAMLVLVAVLFWVERAVVTPTEEVARTLQQIASELSVNNVDGVVSHLSRSAPELEQTARDRLRGVVLEKVKIKRNLDIDVMPDSNPTAASARFNCVVVGTDRGGVLGKRRGAFFFDVNLRKEHDQWRVASYEMKDFREGMRQTTD